MAATIAVCSIAASSASYKPIWSRDSEISSRWQTDTLSTEQFIKQLFIAGAKEINLSKLVKKKSKNSKVREYAVKAIDAGILIYADLKPFTEARTHEKIRFMRVNEKTHKEVPFEKIVKGYFLKDRYVILDKHDFEEAAPEKTKIIELENFVDIKEINPVYYETSYYSEPEKQGRKAYALLLKALVKSKKAGVARFVLRTLKIYA